MSTDWLGNPTNPQDAPEVDWLGNPVQPLPGSAAYKPQSPFEAANMDDATDRIAQNAQHMMITLPNPVKAVMGVAGKVLQPFAAPQQVLFTGIRAVEDLFDGEDETNAWDTMKRGGRSALSYATWGGYQAARLKQGDPRAKAITGYELFKNMGAPRWVARWGGTAADFFLDVPLLGTLGKAGKLDKLTAGLKIGENMAQAFDSPGALRAFAGGVAAAPFTTQPIRRAVEAVPLGVREAGRERLIDPVLDMRTTPRHETEPVKPTLGQFLFDRNRGVPQEIVDIQQHRKVAVQAQYAVLHNEALSSFSKARARLSFEDARQLDNLVGNLADESSAWGRAVIEGQIKALETRTGRTGLYDDALKATNKGVQFDVYSAEKLHGAGLMSEDALKKYQQGDRRHLRRLYSMYGEQAEDQLRRILDRGAPASITFDQMGLTTLYGATLNPKLPPAPPIAALKKSDLTSGPVSQFPSRTPLLDPVQDAERLVTRNVARDVEVGTYDLGDLDLGNFGLSEITALRNVLGWDAVKQLPDGKFKATGVVDNFPVGHPVVQNLFGDLRGRGVTNTRVENRTFAEQVPNYYNPKDGAPLDVQKAWSDAEVSEAGGALYIHNNDLAAFMAGATEKEIAAFDRALERFPMREKTRQVGRNTVEDTWLPVDPADADMARLLDRAKGGAAALFDGANGQPLFTGQLSTKSRPSLPTPQEFGDAVQRAYTNAEQHPADFLNTFFRDRDMDEAHITRILDGIGQDWAQKAGLNWRPSDAQVVRHFTRQRAERGGQSSTAGRGVAAVTTQRQDVSDFYADVLGEVESFTKRLTEQHRVASKAATVNGVVGDIRKYLLDNDLIEQIGTADMGAIHKTAGLRVLSGEQARALGNGFKEGEVIPAQVHRILLEQVDTRKDAPLGLAWQWYSSRWQGIKLANPASILNNIKSGFVMADQAGHSVPELLGGIRDYLNLHRQAVKGDGALDAAARVNGVTMRELFDHGAFTHNTMMNAEVVQRSNQLLAELANPAGSSLQRTAAALTTWLTETPQGAGLAAGYARAVTPLRWLGDTYGRVDSVFKGGLYMAQRRKGVNPEQAAKIADETFFNYESGVPYVVDGLRRFGLLGMPFASFKFLAAGRFMRSLYLNPYGVQKYYRLPNSSRAALADEEGEPGNDTSALQEYDAGSPDYIRQGLYMPLGMDSQGRHRAVRLDDMLPETAVFDSFNADGVAGTVPPAFQLVAQIISGKGYQGRDVYRTGETWADTQRLDPQEAARGVVKALWQFGAYPWAPGQPMTERIVKALAAKSVPVDTITNPVSQAGLKVLTEGPAVLLDSAPWSPERQGSAPNQDVTDALARVFGVKSYPVTGTPAQAGSYRSNQIGRDLDIQALNRMEANEMKAALNDEQRRSIRERYAKLRAPLIERQRNP